MKLKELLEKIPALPWSVDLTVNEDEQPEVCVCSKRGYLFGIVCAPEAELDDTDKAILHYSAHAANVLPELVAALRECVTEDGAHCLAYGADTPKLRARIAAINRTLREAITRANEVSST